MSEERNTHTEGSGSDQIKVLAAEAQIRRGAQPACTVHISTAIMKYLLVPRDVLSGNPPNPFVCTRYGYHRPSPRHACTPFVYATRKGLSSSLLQPTQMAVTLRKAAHALFYKPRAWFRFACSPMVAVCFHPKTPMLSRGQSPATPLHSNMCTFLVSQTCSPLGKEQGGAARRRRRPQQVRICA